MRFFSEKEEESMNGKKTPPSSEAINSWFLGPKSENGELLMAFINDIFYDHIYWRRNFHPEDNVIITESAKHNKNNQDVVNVIKENLIEMLAKFKKDVPFYSPRYLAHMTSDPAIPAILGYIASMLYNPNNVSKEGAPSTLKMEIEVGKDFAVMFGFDKDESWGHLTSGGTTANLEALWIARNLKFFPLAIKALESNYNWSLDLGDNYNNKDETDLLNLNPDNVLDLVKRLPQAIETSIMEKKSQQHV